MPCSCTFHPAGISPLFLPCFLFALNSYPFLKIHRLQRSLHLPCSCTFHLFGTTLPFLPCFMFALVSYPFPYSFLKSLKHAGCYAAWMPCSCIFHLARYHHVCLFSMFALISYSFLNPFLQTRRLLRSLDIMQLHLPPVWHRTAISVLSLELTSCLPSESSSATAAAAPPSTTQHAATYPREALRTGTSLEPNESNSARAVTSSAPQHSTTDPHAAVKAASPAVSSSSSCMAWASSSLAHLVRVAAATHQHQHHRGHHNEEEDAVLTLSVVREVSCTCPWVTDWY